MQKKHIKAAIIQDSPVFLNLNATLDKAERLIKEAAGEGAELIAFPETWFPGYPVWLDSAPMAAAWAHQPAMALYAALRNNSLIIPGTHLNRLASLAKKVGAYLVLSVNEKSGGTLYNSTIYISKDGSTYKIHRKLVPTYSERLVWGRGDGSTLNIMESEFGNIGGLICWEHWMPAARAAMHSMNESIHIACWPTAHELHQLASRTYAFEGGCFVMACGTILSKNDVLEGFDSLGLNNGAAKELLESMPQKGDELILNGGGAIIGPDAKYIVEPVFAKRCIIYADIDLNKIDEMKMLLDTDGHYSRPDIFSISVNTKPMENVSFI